MIRIICSYHHRFSLMLVIVLLYLGGLGCVTDAAFITHSFALRGECHKGNISGGDLDSRRGRIGCQQQQQQLHRQGSTTTRITLLQLEATRTRTTQEDQHVNVAEETIAAAAVTTIQTKHDKKWMQQFDNLKAFQEMNNGHSNVPRSQGRLGRWVFEQRRVFKKGTMREDRKNKLEAIGFVWDLNKYSWQNNYDSLKSYKTENGHCNVPRSHGRLGEWVNSQRMAFKRGNMREDQKKLLEEIGFIWDSHKDSWQNTYTKLEEFQQLHGHMNVPDEDYLSVWSSKQRLDYAAGRLDPKKKAMLDDLGFVWDDPRSERHERQWNEMYRELAQFKLLEGHVRVPVGTSSLGQWVRYQRALYRDDKLLEHRQAKLESIGFVWRLREYGERDITKFEKKWMKKYEELKEFQDKHGHTNVPYKEGSLGRWIQVQRVAFRRDKLREDRKELLDEIGFEWEPRKVCNDELWRAKYGELQAYRNEFGDLNVTYAENMGLYNWIYRQRILQPAGRLNSKQKAMLDELGMEW